MYFDAASHLFLFFVQSRNSDSNYSSLLYGLCYAITMFSVDEGRRGKISQFPIGFDCYEHNIDNKLTLFRYLMHALFLVDRHHKEENY